MFILMKICGANLIANALVNLGGSINQTSPVSDLTAIMCVNAEVRGVSRGARRRWHGESCRYKGKARKEGTMNHAPTREKAGGRYLHGITRSVAGTESWDEAESWDEKVEGATCG